MFPKRKTYGKANPSTSSGTVREYKKPKISGNDDEDDYQGGSFEEDLAMMDDMMDEMADTPKFEGEGPETQVTSIKWSRPNPPSIDPSKDALIFQQLDLDHYVGNAIPGMPGTQQGSAPIMRMFGVTDQGNSICCHVHGFSPYFFVPAPPNFKTEHCRIFMASLIKLFI